MYKAMKELGFNKDDIKTKVFALPVMTLAINGEM